MKAKTVVKIIAALLALGLIIVVLCVAYYYTNGYKEPFQTFVLTDGYGDRVLKAQTSDSVVLGDVVRYEVSYPFDVRGKEKGYEVEIVPNAEADFEYTAGGAPRRWRNAGDLSEAFCVEMFADHFTFKVPAYPLIENERECKTLLKALLAEGESEIVLAKNLDYDAELFELRVASYDGKIVYEIDFSIIGRRVWVQWCGTNSQNSLGMCFDVEQPDWQLGDIIGDYRPDILPRCKIAGIYTDIEGTVPYDTSKPLEGDIDLFVDFEFIPFDILYTVTFVVPDTPEVTFEPLTLSKHFETFEEWKEADFSEELNFIIDPYCNYRNESGRGCIIYWYTDEEYTIPFWGSVTGDITVYGVCDFWYGPAA